MAAKILHYQNVLCDSSREREKNISLQNNNNIMQFVKPITIIIYIRAVKVYGFILFLWLVLLSSRI